MNRLFYKLSKGLSFIPISLLSKLTNQKIFFPFYHVISDKEVIHIKHLYKIRSSKQFENDLDFLLKSFIPADIDILYNADQIKVSKSKPYFLLSFDDGLSEFYDIAAPILLRKGIPAINFLNSGFIDNADLFYRYKLSIILDKLKNSCLSGPLSKKMEQWFIQNKLKIDPSFSALYTINFDNKYLLDELANILEIDFHEYLRTYQPYMTSEQINILIDKGFYFGGHSINHPLYAHLDLNQQLMQTRQSIKDITSKFSLPYKLFSFPFTDQKVSKLFFDTLYSNQGDVDFTFGTAGIKEDIFDKNIQRIPIEIEKFTAENIIYGELYYYIFKSFLNKNKIARA